MLQQLNMFGPPEDAANLDQKALLRDDAPNPAERQLLWPADLVDMLGADLLERLYGSIVRRTRLRIDEVCRELRCSGEHVRRLYQAGSLDHTDVRHPNAIENAVRIYRYSLVRFLFIREFITAEYPRCNLPEADLERCLDAAENIRRKRRKIA